MSEKNVEKFHFINPYNFVPLSSQCAKVQEAPVKGSLSGVIDYSLLTKTPLFIPNTSNDDAFDMEKKVKDHKSYDFFSYRDLSGISRSVAEELPIPVIPGSEMRGMLRANYEIFTNSCMSSVDDDMLLSKRTQDKYDAGLLERCIDGGGRVYYRLWKAEDCLLRTMGADSLEDETDPHAWKSNPKVRQEGKEIWGRKCYIQRDLPEGTEVEFTYINRKDGKQGKALALDVKPVKDSSKPAKGKKRGYILKGESGPVMRNGNGYTKQNKHCAHIFFLKENENIHVYGKPSFKEDYLGSKLDAVLKIYKEFGKSEYNEYRSEYRRFKEGRGNQYFPVYYSVISYGRKPEDEELMLSPACITREIYTRKVSDMASAHRSCEKTDKLCPACAIFGILKSDKNITSRIRVADLTCKETDLLKCFEHEPVTLQPLASPKFNPEFYLKKPEEDAVFWTYEYYVDSKGLVHRNTAGVNGRKFYWHHPEFVMAQCTAKASNLNKTVRPLSAGIQFSGKLFFRDLTEEELNTLCVLINADDEAPLDKKEHGYKLGAAKPLGFGSVALHVDKVTLRSFEKSEEGRIDFVEKPYTPDPSHILADKDTLENYRKVTEFNYLKGENITYPRTEKGGDIFKWFSQNHTGYSVNRSGEKSYNRMPQSRKTMLYEEYLAPMVPKVQRVYSSDAEEAPAVAASQEGKVVGYNFKKTVAYIQVSGKSKRIGIFFKNISKETKVTAKYGEIDSALPLGATVQVRAKGKDPNGYEQWICEKIDIKK